VAVNTGISNVEHCRLLIFEAHQPMYNKLTNCTFLQFDIFYNLMMMFGAGGKELKFTFARHGSNIRFLSFRFSCFSLPTKHHTSCSDGQVSVHYLKVS
jgi:hypothetical protein